jgi:hypothetical protein
LREIGETIVSVPSEPLPQLEYESRLGPRVPPGPPTSICITAMICGTAMILAPWLWSGLGSTNISTSTVRDQMENPLTWLTILPGFALIALGYFRARR